MPAFPLVEDFDVFEQCRLLAGAELCSMNKLGLERAEERLHRRIVIAVTLAAHGGFDAVAVEDLAIRAYCTPRSEWWMRVACAAGSPSSGRPGTTNSSDDAPADDLAVSLMAARYNQPSSVATYVRYRCALPKGPANQIVFG